MSVTVSMAVTAPYCFLFSASIFLAITLLEILEVANIVPKLIQQCSRMVFNRALDLASGGPPLHKFGNAFQKKAALVGLV
jgi:hypothetical protein